MSLDEAFSSSISINRRAAVANAANEGAENFSAENISSDVNKKIIAAVNMARACSTSSAIADKAALRALSE